MLSSSTQYAASEGCSIENSLIESQGQHELRLSEMLNTSFKNHVQYKTDSICGIMSEYTHPSTKITFSVSNVFAMKVYWSRISEGFTVEIRGLYFS